MWIFIRSQIFLLYPITFKNGVQQSLMTCSRFAYILLSYQSKWKSRKGFEITDADRHGAIKVR